MTSETSWNAIRRTEVDEWRLEPGGKTETPETKVLWNGVEGAPGYPDGEGRHERVQVKSSRRKTEAPREEGEEVEGPKRQAIRAESEETQDYVKEAKDLNQDEIEEISFVPSAISVPQKPLFRCDNGCSEKTLSSWQFASVAIKEGEESDTTNLWQQCYNESLVAGGDKPLTNWQCDEFVEKRRIVEGYGK